MNEENTQMTPEEAKASLGIATSLQDQMMPQGQEQTDPNAQNAPQQGEPQQPTKDTPKGKEGAVEAKVELNMTDKLDEIRKELKDDMQREMDGVKQLIEQALTEEDGQDKTDKTA